MYFRVGQLTKGVSFTIDFLRPGSVLSFRVFHGLFSRAISYILYVTDVCIINNPLREQLHAIPMPQKRKECMWIPCDRTMTVFGKMKGSFR